LGEFLVQKMQLIYTRINMVGLNTPQYTHFHICYANNNSVDYVSALKKKSNIHNIKNFTEKIVTTC